MPLWGTQMCSADTSSKHAPSRVHRADAVIRGGSLGSEPLKRTGADRNEPPSGDLPSWLCGFDSRHPLRESDRVGTETPVGSQMIRLARSDDRISMQWVQVLKPAPLALLR